jgi:hypothetical protein
MYNPMKQMLLATAWLCLVVPPVVVLWYSCLLGVRRALTALCFFLRGF